MRLGFLLLIGLPGSGKTTFAKNLVKNFKNYSESGLRFVHVCFDELIPNESYNSAWKLMRNSVYIKIEELVLSLKNKNFDLCPSEFKNQFDCFNALQGDFVIILDDNMYFKSMRYSLFQVAKKHRISFCQLFLNCSLESALSKNGLRTSKSLVPRHVIENMNCKIEPPNCKNNWEKYSIALEAFSSFDEMYQKIFPILNESLDNFCYVKDGNELRELSKAQCEKSVLHQTDLALRKIITCSVKKFISENSNEELKDYIAGLNLRKSEILLDIKSGDLCLPDEIFSEIKSSDGEKLHLINFLNSYF